MATYGRVTTAKNNWITSVPNLPKIPVFGSFNVSCSFESHPTGTIEIEHITERDIISYRLSYRIGRTFSAFGYSFVVAGRAETVDYVQAIDGLPPIKTYKMSVQLEGINQQKAAANIRIYRAKTTQKAGLNYIGLSEVANAANVPFSGMAYRWLIDNPQASEYASLDSKIGERLRIEEKIMDWSQRTARARPYQSGAYRFVSRDDIIYTIELSRSSVKAIRHGTISYSGTTPQLRRKKEIEENLKNITAQAGEVEKIPPETVVIKQGDLDVETPPPDVTFATDLSLTHDGSGPRKTLQISTTIGGQPLKEENITYGFEYQAIDIQLGDLDSDRPLQGVPDWRNIETNIVSYGYQRQTASVRITARDKKTGQGLTVQYLSPQGYRGIEAYYLMQIVTTGRRRGRFTQESLGGDNDSRIISANLQDPLLEQLDEIFYGLQREAIQYRNLTTTGLTGYTIVPMYQLYDDYEEVPYQTQTGKLSDVARSIVKGSAADKTIVYATPDVNYVMPYGVIEEKESRQSFDSMQNPENVFIRDEREAIRNDSSLTDLQKQAELAATPLLPDLTTGEDTYKRITRVIKSGSNNGGESYTISNKKDKEKKHRYTEYEQIESFQDDSYKNGFQTTKFREVVGKVPEASYYANQYQPVNKDEEKKDDSEKERTREINSVGVKGEVIARVSQSYNYDVRMLSQAVRAAECELSLENFGSSGNDQVNLAWFYPDLKPDGTYLSIPDDTGNPGRKRVKSINFTIQFQGFIGNRRLVTCDGTQVTLGNWDKHDLKTRNSRDNDGDENDLNLDIKPSYFATKQEFQESLFGPIEGRRNY